MFFFLDVLFDTSVDSSGRGIYGDIDDFFFFENSLKGVGLTNGYSLIFSPRLYQVRGLFSRIGARH